MKISPAHRLLILLLTPLLLAALLELAFRCGVYERWTKPGSHAGTSVLLKRALRDPRLSRIDTVTLGSSRAVYGIDHAALAKMAERHGMVHANLSMPGVHWMSLGVLSQWLAVHHPQVRGGVIAVAISDFEYAGNGSYELGIVTPFRSWNDGRWIAAHVAPVKGELPTYAVFSALLAYREDVQDYLVHPSDRNFELHWWGEQDLYQRMRTSVDEPGDSCVLPRGELDDCKRLLQAPPTVSTVLAAQCTGAVTTASTQRGDYAAALRGPLPPHMLQLRDLIRAQLSDLRWKKPPVVVLMPMHGLLRDRLMPAGMHEWALEVLRPLVESKTIVLLDRSDDFIAPDGATDCHAFWDLYHQNVAGRTRLAAAIEPEIERALFGQ